MTGDSSKKNQKTVQPWKWIWLLGFIATAVLIFFGPLLYTGPRTTTWPEFETGMLKKGAVERVVIVNKEIAEIYIHREFADDSVFAPAMKSKFFGVKTGPHYTLHIGSVDSFERKLEAAQEDMPEDKRIVASYFERTNWTTLISWIIPIAILILLARSLSRGGSGTSIFGFGRSTARLTEKDDKSKVTFEQVAGLQEAKTEIMEIVDFLKDPTRYVRLGAKIPKGVIIVGPPGTGKTLLAKAVAGEAQVPFFSLSGSEFVEMFVGVGASRVRDLFNQAKAKAPCIVFIDEIDAVGRSRGRNTLYSGSNDERESTLNQLLTEMDGFETNSGVIVLAATNRADILDPALLRPGRFDRHVYLELPNQDERKEIFKVHLKPILLAKDVNIDVLAAQTPGFSGADIANICNEAALIAARRKKESVTEKELFEAIDRIVAGLEKKSKIISREEKAIIAVHESGHAIASWLLNQVDPLLKVSIIPRGKSLGAAWYLTSEQNIQSYSYFKQRLIVSLAGRAAEEVMFSEISSGALDDLEKCTKQAYTMVSCLGFNKNLGVVSFYDSTGRAEYSLQKPFSEETAKLIDQEVRFLEDECYDAAIDLLETHRTELGKMAALLIEKEVIYQADIEKILGKRPARKTAFAIDQHAPASVTR